MEDAETILVIILSSFLAIFLLLGIVLVWKCIQISKQVKRITDKAEQLVDRAESVGEFFQKAAGGFSVGRVLSQVISAVTQRDDTKKGKD